MRTASASPLLSSRTASANPDVSLVLIRYESPCVLPPKDGMPQDGLHQRKVQRPIAPFNSHSQELIIKAARKRAAADGYQTFLTKNQIVCHNYYADTSEQTEMPCSRRSQVSCTPQFNCTKHGDTNSSWNTTPLTTSRPALLTAIIHK